MRFCPNCNAIYEDDQNFCSFCGTKTAFNTQYKTCACGGENNIDSKFCIFCGKSLVEESDYNPIDDTPVPNVQTGSWAKVLISIGVAFIFLTIVCLII